MLRKLFFLLFGCHSLIAQVAFVDVSSELELISFDGAFQYGSGVAAADFDNDGDIDFFLTTAQGQPNLLYRNDGEMQFVEIGESVGLHSDMLSRAALWFDYDGDHLLDLYVSGDCYGTNDNNCPGLLQHRLFKQHDDGTFEDLTIESGLDEDIDPKTQTVLGGVSASDINNDGYLDLLVTAWGGAHKLFLNQGNGKFIDIYKDSGLPVLNSSLWQAIQFDFNEDGYADIYLCRDFEDNELLINNRDLTFTSVAESAGANIAFNDMGIALGDYDNDNAMDLYITNIFEDEKHNVMLQNISNDDVLKFEDVAKGLGIDQGGWGWGTTFLDADNDGWLDLAATNGWIYSESGYQSKFWLNQADGTFSDESMNTGFDDLLHATTVISFDIDRDGDLDLLQTLKANENQKIALRVLDNQTDNQSNYLVVKPRLLGANHFGIGATVKVTAGELQMVRPILAGMSFYGQEPAEAFFGMANHTHVDRVEITWPNGRKSEWTDVSVNQIITLSDEDQLQVPTQLNAEILDPHTISLTWDLTTTIETGFVIQKSLTSSFDEVDEFIVAKTERQHLISNHPTNTKVYYRICSYDKNERSAFCLGIKVEMEAQITKVADVGQANGIFYPNPTQGTISVLFNKKEVDQIHVRITNVSGQEVIAEFLNVMESKLVFDLPKQLPNGVYLMEVKSKKMSYVNRIVLKK